jgi:peptidoglycan/xylan/chitin deacetylase (PgdA/CDA1 family)
MTNYAILLSMKRLISLLLFSVLAQASTLTNYEVTHFCIAPHSGEEITIIRTFMLDNEPYQLTVDTRTLHTSITSRVLTMGHDCGDSRYSKLLQQSITPPASLQNDGITHGKKGVALTTDLCPSSKEGFERGLYEAITEKFPAPVPVTLFITGKWIEKHEKAFQQFIRWQQEHNLSITWGNHTYNHPYHPKEPLEKNFALSKGYDLREDTLKLEKLLIEQGLTPSVFFRFPGLVSDAKTIQTIHDLGLITIGSDTWIAKGQKVKEGSIVLLHGNKNEPKGVKIFLEMVDQGKIQGISPLRENL